MDMENFSDLIKAFIRVRNADSKQPIDETTAAHLLLQIKLQV